MALHQLIAILSGSLSVQLILLTLVLFCLYSIFSRVQTYLHERTLLPLPPGPPGLPLIGNLIEVLKVSKIGEQHLLFEQWARQYGEIYRVKVGLFTQYMVNTDVAVKAIFDKPAAVSANRPTWLVSREHICNDWNVLLLNADTPRWKMQRKITWGNVGSIPRANAGLPFLHFESLKMLHEIACDQEMQIDGKKLWRSVMRYTYSTFASQFFGLDLPNSTDPAIGYIHETGVAQILGTLPGWYIVEILPWLDRLPLFMKPWERAGRERFQRDREWCLEKMRRVKEMTDRSAIQESLLCKIIEDEKNLGFESEDEGAYFCLMLTIGAADTSQISTWSFMEAMMTFPEVQRKAREEIEKVVGDQIPTFEDYDRIPYVRCLVKETWRWRPPVGLGHPHVTTADITYNGMRIPKGSRINLNGWALQHDPVRHADPQRFWPERYEGDETTAMQSINSSSVEKRDHFAFGAGRRICPGYNVAERSLAVAIMRILWAFEIKPAKDAQLPLNIADYRGDFPGMPGSSMPITMLPVSEARAARIDSLFQLAVSERSVLESLDG